MTQYPYSRKPDDYIIKQMKKNEKLSKEASDGEKSKVRWNTPASEGMRIDTKPILIPKGIPQMGKGRERSHNITSCLQKLVQDTLPTSIAQIEQNIGRLSTGPMDEEAPIYEEVRPQVQHHITIDLNDCYERITDESDSDEQDNATQASTISEDSEVKNIRMKMDPQSTPCYGNARTETDKTDEEHKLYHTML